MFWLSRLVLVVQWVNREKAGEGLVKNLDFVVHRISRLHMKLGSDGNVKVCANLW